MSKKKHARINVPMYKTTDMDDRLVIDSLGIQSTFDPDGTLTSGDVTHLNFSSDEFMIMFDAESNLLTLTSKDKNIYYNLDDLKKQIESIGKTTEEMEELLKEQENNTQKGDEEHE